jgi:transposase
MACESGETMSRRPRRNHTPTFKSKVAGVKGDRTLAQLAEQFDVHPNQSTSWKAQIEGGAADVLGPGGGSAAQPAIDVTEFRPHSRSIRVVKPPLILISRKLMKSQRCMLDYHYFP